MTKASPERKQAIIMALEQGMTRGGAAAMGDISRETFYEWLDTDLTFSDAVQKAISKAESRFLLRVTEAAQKGTWQAAAWWLERRMPESYALDNRRRVEVSGPGGGPIVLSHALAQVPHEELEAAVKELEAELGDNEPEPDEA